jgi:hypothetical protein
MDTSQGFPHPQQPFLDPKTGQVTEAWRRFLLALWNRTGQAPGVNSEDLLLLEILQSLRTSSDSSSNSTEEDQGTFLALAAAYAPPPPQKPSKEAMMALLRQVPNVIPLYTKIVPVAVASLPTAPHAGTGSKAFVNDATLTIILGIGTTVVGGGANLVPVYSDGTNWIIG